MKVNIIYDGYLNKDGNGISIGGIQTYITSLIPVFKKKGIDCIIYQSADFDFEKNIDGVVVYGVKTSSNLYKAKRRLLNECKNNFQKGDIVLYASELWISSKTNMPSIAIQHGISWDIPNSKNKSVISNYLYSAKKFLQGLQISMRIKKADLIVCVDHNFINWYKALLSYPEVSLKPVLNYTKIAPQYNKKTDYIEIIFARRFFEYRGTRLFGEAIKRILAEYDNVKVTIAGSGPDRAYFEEAFGINPNVNITNYRSEESLEIHKDKHIAVVPTVGSEGTSLSLLEAMSAQCAVICTNVGGMTNIVIDEYNGLMITPDEDELYEAIKRLIDDENLRNSLANKAYETVSNGFSYEKWSEKWSKIIDEFIKEHNCV